MAHDNDGPILVRMAVSEEEVPEGVRVDVIANTGAQRTLNLNVPVEVLSVISENTEQLKERLNKFVNGLNGKIQSLTTRTTVMVQNHQTQSLRTVAEAQHCNETMKQLIEEYEEIEAGFEEVRRIREIVDGLKQRVEKLEKIIG